jgi:signal transduction histidine kinase
MAYYDQPQRFDPIAIQTAETIARQVALAIARLRAAEALESLVASRTKSLQAALEQMEEFSYTVSHDLRAPVRSMRSFIEVIKEDHGAVLSTEVRGHLDRVQRSAARMDALVRDTLAYSRVARLECELAPIALDQVVQDVIAGLETNPSRHAIRVASPLGTVMGQEMCLNQAISNLLHNALKFTKPGQAPDIDISATANEDHVTLFVRDRGIGIPAAAQPRLFRMFERLHSPGEYEGTGIGLAIVRKAVERMQGTVGMESDGQTGSTFWLRLRRG